MLKWLGSFELKKLSDHIFVHWRTDLLFQFQAFHKAIIEGGIDLSEPEEVKAEYEPGIDYDNKEEVANLLQRQRSVYNLGRTSILTKFLKKKRKLLRRNRPLQSPVNLDMPSYTFT